MHIRPKTYRRLGLLLSVLLVFAGVTTLLLVRTVRRQHAEIQGLKQSAFKAYQLKDYPAAVSLFDRYASRSHDNGAPDPEFDYEYADARANTPLEGNRHVYLAIGLFQRYLDIAPADPHDARHKLLKLFLQVRYNTEARKLAADLLKKNPNDVESLRAEVTVFLNEHNTADALAACQKLDAVDPGNLPWERRELLLMAEVKKPNEQIVAHANELLQKHPGDARFQALVGMAYQITNDPVAAGPAIEATAKLPPPQDVDSVREIVALFDDVQRFDLSERLIFESIKRNPDPRLLQLRYQRLFERQQFATLADELKDVDPKSSGASSTLLAYRAMALYEQHHRPEATAVVDAIASRHDDVSTAWTEALHTRYASPPPDPAVMIKAYHDAIVHDPENPVLHFFLGDARSAMGETDEAIREWTKSARLSRTWAMPLYRISRMLSNTGHYPAALQAAALLNRRAPSSPATEVAYAVAQWGLISNNPAEVNGQTGDGLLKVVENIRAKLPGESDVLPLYVALLSRRGQRDKAIEVAKSALAATPPPPENVMGQLAAVSDQEKLGLGEFILSRAEQSRGMTPAVAYARALSLYNSGKKDESLELVKSLRQDHPNDPVWMLGEARFREEVKDPDALKTWIALADANPSNINVQYQALGTSLRFSDRDFWKRTIDRVKSLTGDDAQAWQVEQARFDLSGQPQPADLDRVIASLRKIVQASPELADVHRLLADALLRTGKPENLGPAGVELTAAHDLQPDDFATTAELVSVLLRQGLRDRAVALVDGVAHSTGLPLDRRLWVAQTYAQMGNSDAALSMLTAADAPQEDPNLQAMLAGLCTRTGRLSEAGAIYLKLADNPSAPPAALMNGASFFAASGQTAKADHFVALLKKFNLSPGSLELFQAHLQEMEHKPQDAITTLSQASKSSPKVEQLWQELAGIYLRGGSLDDADKVAAEGLKAIPSSEPLAAVRSEIGSIRSIGRQDAVALIDAISHNPKDPALEQTIKLLADAKARQDAPQQTLAGLRQLADQYPGFFPLQEITALRYVQARQFKEAASLASRSSELAPNDPAPLKLLCHVYMSSGDYDSARAAARRWRAASLADPLEPDINTALTYLLQSNPDANAAVKQLDPYMAADAAEPQKQAATPIYCQALITAGRTDDAAARLEPLLAKSPRWAGVWLELSSAQPTAPAAADWLKRLQAAHPPEAAGEKVAFAAAWEHVGERFGYTPAEEAARDMVQPLIAGGSVEPGAWWTWAMTNHSLGNLPEADHGWQEYLKLNPSNPQARNNYAFVLVLEGGADKLPKAEKLATEAIAAAPQVSTFYDTLARIQSQMGKKDEAVKNFRTALGKDPADVEAMIGLADMLQSQPAGRDEARSLLTRINSIVESGTPLAPQIRQELDRVKSALSSSI